jgi:hypothetical protein
MSITKQPQLKFGAFLHPGTPLLTGSYDSVPENSQFVLRHLL